MSVPTTARYAGDREGEIALRDCSNGNIGFARVWHRALVPVAQVA